MEFETARAYAEPSVHQFSVFFESRVGKLRGLIEKFRATDVHIVGLSVLDTTDSAIVRFIFDDADRAREVLDSQGRAYSECELLAVELSEEPNALLNILSNLLHAEINLHYAYPMMRRHGQSSAIALHVDDRTMAIRALRAKGFNLLDQTDVL